MTSATGSDDARLPEWSGNLGGVERCAVRSRGCLGAGRSLGLRRQAGRLKVWRGGGCKFSVTKRAHKRNAGQFDTECRRPSLITTTDTLAGIATACVQRPRLLWKNLPPAGRSRTSGPAPLVLLKSASIPLAADLNAARQPGLERFQKFCSRQRARPNRNTRQRLGLRQPSAALRRPPSGEKAAEGCRSPKPRGIIQPAFRCGHSFC